MLPLPDIKYMKGSEIAPLTLTPTQEQICSLIISVSRFFFLKKVFINIPFRGFLLEGPPGNGKTEIAKQAARRLDLELGNVFLVFIDTAEIAEPRWGEAEKKLRNVFNLAEKINGRVILLFDDIDCLAIRRGAEVAKEWHYSINALIFHELDKINPRKCIVIATTNQPSLIDPGLRSRLFSIKVPSLPIDELREIAYRLIIESVDDKTLAEMIIRSVVTQLKEMKQPSIRDVQHLIIKECINKGVWLL